MTSIDCSEGSSSVPSLTTWSRTSSLSLLLSPDTALERAPTWQIYLPAPESHSSGHKRPPTLCRGSEQASWFPLGLRGMMASPSPHTHVVTWIAMWTAQTTEEHSPSSNPVSAACKSLVCTSVTSSAHASGLYDHSAVEPLYPRVHSYRFNYGK